METWHQQHFAPWDIQISSKDTIQHEYCLDLNSEWNCIHRMIVNPESSIYTAQLSQTESLTNTAVFVIVIMLLVRLVKWIFRLIIPTKWRRD